MTDNTARSDRTIHDTSDEDHDDQDQLGIDATDLRTFQLEILYELVESGPDYGLGLKRSLEARLDERIHNGRLYPNLDELFELGLVEKRVRDQRTNEYALSNRGRILLCRDARRRAAVVDGLDGGEAA